MDTAQVSDLLQRWRDLRARGRHVSAEELCRSAPELLPELEKQIAALEALGPALQVRASGGRAPQTEHFAGDLEKQLRSRLLLVCWLILIPITLAQIILRLELVPRP